MLVSFIDNDVTIRGRLLSPVFARGVLPTLDGASTPSAAVVRELERLGELSDEAFGPASGARRVADLLAVPFARALGFQIRRRHDAPDEVRLDLVGTGPAIVPVLVRGWADDLDATWREAVRTGVTADARWCLMLNGRVGRVVDTQRTWLRCYLEFDFSVVGT